MAKSVNEYYSEKMKKLLEMQERQNTPGLASSATQGGPQEPQGQKGGRGYYENFRERVRPAPDNKRQADGRRPATGNGGKADPRSRAQASGAANGQAGPSGTGQGERKRPKINPEQTTRDRMEEYLRQVDAMKTAKRARVLRKVRDGIISAALIVAVFTVMCIVVYRLLFVINDISAQGSEKYSSEELVAASGVDKGDHLFSFSSKDIGRLMTLRCPEVAEVDVERTPPGKIVFNIKEEKAAFYADFYGEYRMVSEGLRVLGSVTEEDARSGGGIRLVIPDVISATAGDVPVFKDVRDDSYIYDVTRAVLDSRLGDRAGSLDLSDKYNIVMTVDGKYILKLGDSESMATKLKIAAAVLDDEMFNGDTKATIDVTDLSEASVVVDQGLEID